MARNKQKAKGKLQEARIIASLKQKTKTTAQLADALGMCRSNAAIYLARLHAAPRRIFVIDHEKRTGSPAPIWAVGSRPDAEYVPHARPTPKTSHAERLARALELLTEKARTVRELGPAMNVVPGTVARYVRDLRNAEPKQAFIKTWRPPSEVNGNGTRRRLGAGVRRR